jgi:hypothetical protein
MKFVQAARKPLLALVAAASLVAGMSAVATPAVAHGHVSIGIGLGFPLYPAYGYGYYGYYRPWYPAYYPPPVVYAPPPVYVQPAYVQPVYQAPIQAVPTSDVYRANNGQYCREYQSTVRVAGHYENSYGTACQQPDGSWRVVD